MADLSNQGASHSFSQNGDGLPATAIGAWRVESTKRGFHVQSGSHGHDLKLRASLTASRNKGRQVGRMCRGLSGPRKRPQRFFYVRGFGAGPGRKRRKNVIRKRKTNVAANVIKTLQ